MLHQAFAAMETGQPYGIGAYFAYRHDPLTGLPDPEATKNALDKLKFLVSIDVSYSETGWFSDVILPESTYLERANILMPDEWSGACFRNARPGYCSPLRQPPCMVDLQGDTCTGWESGRFSTSRPLRNYGTISSMVQE